MTSICILLQNDYELDVRVRRKAEALAAAGYSVDVLALRGSGRPKRYTLHGVNVVGLKLRKKRGSLARYAFEYGTFFVWAMVRVTLQMVRRRYALVDVNTLPDFLVFAAALTRLMGAKIVLDMHEITPEFYMSKYGLPERARSIRLMTFLERASFRFADHVITINEPIQQLLAGRGLRSDKSTVIMNTVDEERFAATREPTVARAPEASFVMMYHGTLTRLYGLDIAIEALALARESMPGAQLWILGDGPEAPHLRELADRYGLAERVRMVGQLPPSVIPAWLHACDVGLLPIRRDVFLEFASPNKLAEFIVTGKPVIISRLRAVRHHFSDKALAYCEPNDPAKLAEEMVRLYSDTGLRIELAARATEEYAPIRWEVMKRRYLALILRLLVLGSDVVTRSPSTVRSSPAGNPRTPSRS